MDHVWVRVVHLRRNDRRDLCIYIGSEPPAPRLIDGFCSSQRRLTSGLCDKDHLNEQYSI